MSPKQRQVLQACATWKQRGHDYHPNARQIALHCGRDRDASDWAHAPLRALLDDGLILIVGEDYRGRQYRPTKQGFKELESGS